MNQIEYDIMYAVEESHWWYVALHELITGFVAREARGRGALEMLDAGCGTGRLCQLLAPFGNVTGCDLSEHALELCRQRGLQRLFQADLGTADLDEERYDIITSIDVIYHQSVSDETRVLSSFCRALKPGGLLILNLVAHEFLRSTHDIAVQTRRRYTERDLLPLVTAAGLRVERATYRLGLLFLPIACYRIARRLLPFPGNPREVASDVRLPHAALNRLLLGAMRAENRFLQQGSLPVGTSIFITARKPLAG